MNHADLGHGLGGGPPRYSSCAFQTDRLLVKEWHSFTPQEWREQPLDRVVCQMLTGPVTVSLPEDWGGGFTLDRARAWILERDGEGSVLLAVDMATLEPVGLLILFEEPEHALGEPQEVRIGYLLAETSWGKGLATELVRGFVTWCRDHSSGLISAGVAPGNRASIAVLEKAGFELVSGEPDSDRLYGLTIT